MFTALKELFVSKTTWLVIVGSAVSAFVGLVLPHLGLPPETNQTILIIVGSLFGVKGIQQASADFSKNQATPPKDTVK